MRSQRGFTLIEMAIVLVIITILIGGLVSPLAAQIQARRVAETRKTMEEARDAILGYAMTHPAVTAGKRYLPCPDQTGDGREDRISNNPANGCTTSRGSLPWVTLGTASQDAWGNRLLYAVDVAFAHGTNGFSTSTALPNPLQMCSTHTCPIPYNASTLPNPYVASNVVFVVVSLGANGWGALNVNGNTLAAPTGVDEVENTDGDQAYVSRTPTQVGGTAGEFDDMLVWVSDSLLKARVCPPGSDCAP